MAPLKTGLLWDERSYIEEGLDISHDVSTNIVRMFEAEQTIPFIARYRQAETKGMGPEELRRAERLWKEAKTIQARGVAVLKQLDKLEKKDETLIKAVKLAKSLDEIESLYAPFKPGAKGSLCERAKAVGLEAPAMQILTGEYVDTGTMVNPKTKGLETVAKVETGIMHIISDYVAKNPDTPKYWKERVHRFPIKLVSSFSKCPEDKIGDQAKYKDYAQFSNNISHVKPHQTLAINRGEEQKLLSVKVDVPDSLERDFGMFVSRKYLNRIDRSRYTDLMNKCIKDCFTRIVSPQMCRNIRSNLKKEAELASVDVFASNLKQLLLQAPCKRAVICGIDPGFTHGCKCAIISQSCSVLATTVFYLPRKGQTADLNTISGLRKYLAEHKCSKIALGNGTGCRETELLLTAAIKNNYFSPLNVRYSIVNECGASIYSVTDVAKDELPNMEPNLRSAVSIARRLQDPLAELVKIEPKHLGVGMYQHDVNEKLLCSTLDSVVEECVSFVGVDLNTCSLQLLQRTAGMNAKRAEAVLTHRTGVGRIESRATILDIKGIGKKSFEQAAGFLRVFAAHTGEPLKEEEPGSFDSKLVKTGTKRKANSTAGNKSKRKKLDSCWNPLDATSVHPESYDHAFSILKLADLTTADVGTGHCKTSLHKLNAASLAAELDLPVESVKQIVDALCTPIQHDFREENSEPLFRQGVLSLDEVRVGMVLSGQVTNVTHFGAFIDVGVGTNGLLHCKEFRNGPPVGVGQPVQVKVQSIERERKRIGLLFA